MEQNGTEFSEGSYDGMIKDLFVRFPSYQKSGAEAYKPGIANMEFFDQLDGHPHRKYPSVHVAGTNGKGSVCSMLASVLAAAGLRVGLYTSPHILDFRERMRIVDGRDNPSAPDLYHIGKREVWDFMKSWGETFDHLDLSFFEITTSMAFSWFASREVDIAVIETGLGGRLDSTNIISPVLSVITNIGFDHCDMLGSTLAEIAFEKAGIIKRGVPAVIGESNPETDPVFERKVLYSNLSFAEFGGDRGRIMSLLTFADKYDPGLWDRHEEILAGMDLRGEYQVRNLRTALAALDVLDKAVPAVSLAGRDDIIGALENTAVRTGLRGRWETLSENPRIICDIGHNAHGLKYNFRQLERMLAAGECGRLVIVYGTVADKDFASVFPLMPDNAVYVFTNASGKRACPSDEVMRGFQACRASAGKPEAEAYSVPAVRDAVALAMKLQKGGLLYIGGSTYVVSEAVAFLERNALMKDAGAASC